MRNICYVFALGIVLGVVTSCKDQPRKDVIITKMPPKQVVSKEIGKVGDYSQARKIEWVGSTYTIEVNRTADVSTDPVDDGSGNRYYPNRILVRIYRPDGSEFFKREFTKGDFESHLDASYKKHTVLLGVVFDHADDDYIYLASSVGSPDRASDEFIPLLIKVSRMGDVSISKDTQMDTKAVNPMPVPKNDAEEDDGV